MNILSVKAKKDKRIGAAYRSEHFVAHSEVS
jgi:hypothetical protein